LAGDPFVNNALSGLMESLASISGIFFIAWLGFVKANVGSLAFSCATCLLSTIAIEVGRGNEGEVSLAHCVGSEWQKHAF